ncbi:hypothetical protein B0H13DRAFT_1870233 [Mycena leptocephala]|nr:hypothetical protein B0H13DRAFT_1870233 [Mycena leptocephala]
MKKTRRNYWAGKDTGASAGKSSAQRHKKARRGVQERHGLATGDELEAESVGSCCSRRSRTPGGRAELKRAREADQAASPPPRELEKRWQEEIQRLKEVDRSSKELARRARRPATLLGGPIPISWAVLFVLLVCRQLHGGRASKTEKADAERCRMCPATKTGRAALTLRIRVRYTPRIARSRPNRFQRHSVLHTFALYIIYFSVLSDM